MKRGEHAPAGGQERKAREHTCTEGGSGAGGPRKGAAAPYY